MPPLTPYFSNSADYNMMEEMDIVPDYDEHQSEDEPGMPLMKASEDPLQSCQHWFLKIRKILFLSQKDSISARVTTIFADIKTNIHVQTYTFEILLKNIAVYVLNVLHMFLVLKHCRVTFV